MLRRKCYLIHILGIHTTKSDLVDYRLYEVLLQGVEKEDLLLWLDPLSLFPCSYSVS